MVRPISRKNAQEFDQHMMELHNILTQYFPVININDPVPLGFRLEKQLAELSGISIERAKRFIFWYCSKPNYLKCIISHDNRVNLKGEIVSLIEPEPKENARNKLNTRGIPF